MSNSETLPKLGTIITNQKEEILSSEKSDPRNASWMKGFPPKKEDIVSAADGSFAQFPAFRYSICHIREFLPTKEVKAANDNRYRFVEEIDEGIGQITFSTLNSDNKMTWQDSLLENYFDGILVLHKGILVYEKYFGELSSDGTHSVMSVSKSILGILAANLIEEGLIDSKAFIGDYIPELINSGFGDATVRQLLDMTTALDYNEDYSDPHADVWQFSNAGDPFPKPQGYKGAKNYYEYLQSVKKSGNHGEIFSYKTINTDALGWVLSRITGHTIPHLVSELLWKPLGANVDGYYQIDASGIPFAGGGFNANLRDLGLLGEMIRNNGYFNGKQIIARAAIEDIRKGGSKEVFSKAEYTSLPNGSYRNMWWNTHNPNGAFTARGVFGQAIYIDPKAEMVIVRLASNPVASNQANDPISLPAYQAVAEYLMKKNP